MKKKLTNLCKIGRNLLLVLAFACMACLPAMAQNKTFSFNKTDYAVSKIFKEIEKNSDYTFFINDNLYDVNQKITINVENASLKEVLDLVFKGTSFTYEFVDKQIVIKKTAPKPALNNPSPSVQPPFNGFVTDTLGQPIIGAYVLEEGTKNGTTTDLDGKFQISVPANANLVISYIGYDSKVANVGNASQMTFILKEDSKNLEEIVIVGYGTQKKINVTGAISSIDAKALANKPLTNATQALQGIQGVYVNQAGAQPGSDGATIRIRGVGTLNNNDPLILIDGIEFPLSAINPNDIESITVLKDAASSAIYGARAANGVILVKTKVGQKGNFKVNYSNYLGFQQATYLPNFTYDPVQFMEMRNQAQINEGKLKVDYSDALIEEYRQGMLTDPITYPSNNWLDIMYNNAFIQDHTMRFSGGSDKYTYSLSLGYGTQDGVLRGTDATTYTIAVNTTAQVTKRLKVGANINSQYKIWNAPVSGVSNLVQMTYKATAFHPTYTADGRYANTFVRTPGHNIYRHPLALADEGVHERKSLRSLANLSAEYRFPLDIVYNLNVGLNKYDFIETIFAPDVYEYDLKTNNATRVNFDGQNIRHTYKLDNNNLSVTAYNTLGWNQTINDKHEINLMLGASFETNESTSFSGQIEGYLGNELHELNAGVSNPQVTGSSSASTLASAFGRVGYVYNKKYMVEGVFRYDGSSRFAEGRRWGFFPSFSAGWRLKEENFMKNVSWVSDLKLRGSWGQIGNERIAMFRYIDLINLGYDYPFNDNIYSGAAVTAYNDPNITWETTTITNIGIDAALLGRRLDFSVELFDKRTSDILRSVTLPDQVGGLAGPIRNIGTVSNKGLEINLGYRDNIGNFRYGINGNVTFIKNEIVDLKGQTIIDGKFILQEGLPIDSYYMLHSIGIFQSQEEIDNSPYQTAATKPGYLKFEDTDGDGVITEGDRQVCGGVIPKATYSFNINLGYKGWDLTAQFQGVHDVATYGDQIGATPLWFGCGLPQQWITDSWTPERGTSATLPLLTTYEGCLNENFRVNDFWLRDASYLRLKNVQLTYTVPQSFLKHLRIKEMRIFANGQNLLTFSPMKEFDPEKDLKAANFYAYPSVKTFTAGINLTF